MRRFVPNSIEVGVISSIISSAAPLALCLSCLSIVWSAESSLVLTKSAWFDERTGTQVTEPDVRVHVNMPLDLPLATPARVLIYALPNGNTIEQTLGCRMSDQLDWHYDIQHVAAQVRLLRSIQQQERLVLVCAEANGLSWPAWRQHHRDANRAIAELVDAWRIRFGGKDAVVTLAAHSGGGSFMSGLIEGSASIPGWIDRIAFLDANYSFDDEAHADKLMRWLAGSYARHLVVLAYDDRHIELNGKRIVGPDGGTFRATRRMVEAASDGCAISKTQNGLFTEHTGLDGRILFFVHTNPENKILHTALVGEMNGLVHTLTVGTPLESKWGTWGGPRAYKRWVQPLPDADNIPARRGRRATSDCFPVATSTPGCRCTGWPGIDAPGRAIEPGTARSDGVSRNHGWQHSRFPAKLQARANRGSEALTSKPASFLT